jgi:hypothetical protein
MPALTCLLRPPRAASSISAAPSYGEANATPRQNLSARCAQVCPCGCAGWSGDRTNAELADPATAQARSARRLRRRPPREGCPQPATQQPDANDVHGLAQLVRTGWFREIAIKSMASRLAGRLRIRMGRRRGGRMNRSGSIVSETRSA